MCCYVFLCVFLFVFNACYNGFTCWGDCRCSVFPGPNGGLNLFDMSKSNKLCFYAFYMNYKVFVTCCGHCRRRFFFSGPKAVLDFFDMPQLRNHCFYALFYVFYVRVWFVFMYCFRCVVSPSGNPFSKTVSFSLCSLPAGGTHFQKPVLYV